MEEPTDSMLGDFRILSRIKVGSGTQGAVYKAVCEGDGFPRCPRGTVVALKAMPVTAEGDRQFEKLRRNVETLAGLDHPNIVHYLGCFTTQVSFSEQHVVIQEYLEGETLAARLAASGAGLDADEALRVVKGMVAGLAAAVGRGIIHRDIKPANVFLCTDGSVKLIDFEVSRRADGSSTASSGNMVGSFDYMAPEFTDPAFCGDEQSDIFSAGVVMHETFIGSLPYPRGTATGGKINLSFFERWARDGNGELINGGCHVSYRIDRVISHAKPVFAKALAPDRANRFATFAEFADALSDVRFRELKSGKSRYQILQFIGKGGFGEVFKARLNKDGRLVAVKHLLKPDYATRFYREARIMSELRDPCFVRFLEFITIDRPGVREAFLVMDFLPGMPGNSLRDAIRRSAGNGIDFESAVKAFARYAHGLSVLHGRGIYHRDIKPSNLYFPEGRPDESAIMDLGIARDENGTKTNGQLPGTLDYMPPETAFGGTRGDATMDIYALGLCFYEALTGKKGYPSLPSGNAAFAQFFKRARDKKPPTFDDERVTSRPALLALLVRMTDPDCDKRLSSAAELELGLKRLLAPPAETAITAVTAPGDDAAAQGESTVSELPDSEETDAGEEAATGETMWVKPSQVAKIAQMAAGKPIAQKTVAGKTRSERSAAWRTKARNLLSVRLSFVLSSAAAVVSLAAFGFFVVPALCNWLNDFLVPQRAGAEIAGVSAVHIANGAEDFYGDDSVPLEKADALRDRWLAERRPPVLSKDEYAQIVNLLAEKRKQRIVRDRLDEARSRIDAEAKAVIQAYHDEGIEVGDERRDRWLQTWRGAAPNKLDRAAKRIAAARDARLAHDAARALVPEAEAEAGRISRNYAIDELVISDESADKWRNRWQERLPQEDYERMDRMLADARKRVMGKISAQASRSMLNSCRGMIEMMSPVESRMNRLAEAETMLQSEIAAGRIEAKAAEGLLADIARRRTWTVFEVENRSGLELDIDGKKVTNGSTQLFVYTNSPPSDMVAVHAGYEPFAFSPQLNGRRIGLMPEHFTMLRVLTKVPPLEKDVACQIDGVMVRGGEVRLMPGTHECVYFKPNCKSQSFPFRVEPSTPSALPSPGPWIYTDEWLRRSVPVKVSLPEMEGDMTCTVDGTPATGTVEVLPGDHVCIFSRPDYMDIRHDFTVRAGEPVALPAPYRWRETEGLAALVAAEAAVDGGDWNQAAALLQAADVKGEDGLKRKCALGERLVSHKRCLLRIDDAAAASMDARWEDVVKIYAALAAEKYAFTEEDRRRVDAAEANVRGNLAMRRQMAVRNGSNEAVEKIDAEISRLDDMVRAMRGAYGKRGGER